MKKRIVGLLLALCLIVGLLPITALAEEAATYTVKCVRFTTGGGGDEKYGPGGVKEWKENFKEPVYGKTSADGLLIDWETATASDYNIAINQSAAGLEIELKNAYMKQVKYYLFAIWVDFDGPVTIKLTGNNVLTHEHHNTPACLLLRAKSTVITGGGSLTAYSSGWSSSDRMDYDGDGEKDDNYYLYGSTIDCDGDLTIKDVTLDLKQDTISAEPWAVHTLRCSGNVVIDHATVNMYAQWGSGIFLGANRTVSTVDTTGKTITIKNGAKVTADTKNYTFRFGETGSLIIDAANGTDVIAKSETAPFIYTPELQGTQNSEVLAGLAADGSDAKAYTGEAKKKVEADSMLYFSLTHKHTGGTATCTKKAVCTICNNEYGETVAHTYTRTDCTKDSVCSVCNQVVAKAGAHEGGTATCKEKAVCTICKQAYGELGAHTGGTATCVAKAKCDVCGAEYGELGGHVPEPDDKNCTTEQKCTLCKTVLVAAKTHKYINDKDKSCENSGCAYIRGSETTTNPNTGDISILLTAAVALSSAVGFAGITVLRKKEN